MEASMNGRHRRLQGVLICLILAAGSLAAGAPASAQTDDSWSFVITPQVWVSHIAKNGFASPPNSSLAGQFLIVNPDGTILQNPFSVSSSPNESVNPQWGVQMAAQKGRLTLAAGFQYVTFETRNDLTYVNPQGFPVCAGDICVNSGQRWAQEFVDTTRMDVDLSASYFFPDLWKDRLDASLGVGFKFIYASASRDFGNLSQTAAIINGASPGLYTICGQNDCSDIGSRDRVKEFSQIYGVTFPMNVTVHLTRDSRWLLPFSIIPLIGFEHRNDRSIVYDVTLPPDVFADPFTVTVNRRDGNKFAYGFTSDLSVRYIINETLSAYAGFRVQYINSFDKYLAYGPLVGMSVRFGGK
jgi:hypothetical protein